MSTAAPSSNLSRASTTGAAQKAQATPLHRRILNAAAGLHPALLEWRVRDAVRRNVPRQMTECRVPGVQFAAALGGRRLVSLSLGERDAAAKAPMLADTPFLLGSLVKPVTAVCVLRLAQERRVVLDAPLLPLLEDVLPPEVFSRRHAEHLTLRTLLSHTCGFATRQPPHLPPGVPATVVEALRGIHGADGVPLHEAPPLAQCRYSGTNYALAEVALDRLLGGDGSFSSWATSFLESVGFGSMAIRRTLPAAAEQCSSKHHDESGRVSERWSPISAICSGLAASAADLARFWMRVVEDAQGRGSGILSPEWAALAFTPQPPGCTTAKFALGLHVHRYDGTRTLDHMGIRPGMRAMVRVHPEARVAAVIVTNGERGEEIIHPLLEMIRAAVVR